MKMKHKLNSFIAFLLCLIITSCNAQPNNAVAPTAFSELSKDSNTQILDVRTKQEFENGHIKNALLADWNNQMEFTSRTKHLDKTKPVLIYCLSGGRSGAAALMLRNKGFQVTELTGGINAWRQNNLPLEGTKKEVGLTLGEFKKIIQSHTNIIVDFGAKWCPPCKQMEPVINYFKTKYTSVYILQLDADKDSELFDYFKINTLPTFYFFVNGIKKSDSIGILTKDQIIKRINP